MWTREVNWWTATSYVSLLNVLLIRLLAGEQHPTPFHGASGPADIIFKSLFHRSVSMARVKLAVEAARTWSWSGIVGPATAPREVGGWRSRVTTS